MTNQGFPDSIGKRQFQAIMDVTDLKFDMDLSKITKDMRKSDRQANRLHLLLMDDPLISGNPVPISTNSIEEFEVKRLKSFKEQLENEEREFGEYRKRVRYSLILCNDLFFKIHILYLYVYS